MKIGLFSDPHYCRAEVLCKTRRPNLSLRKIRQAMDAFAAAGVDLVFCLGDLTDHAPGDSKADVRENFREIIDLLQAYPLPFYLVPGNHDYLMMTAEEMAEEGNLLIPPYTVQAGGVAFIVLDANYRSDMRRFDRAGVEWTDANLPPEQMEFLRHALESSSSDCIILIHENLDPAIDSSHRVNNAGEISALLSGYPRVKMVIQGHYHPGGENVCHGARYLTLPAMCEGTKNPYKILEY